MMNVSYLNNVLYWKDIKCTMLYYISKKLCTILVLYFFWKIYKCTIFLENQSGHNGYDWIKKRVNYLIFEGNSGLIDIYCITKCRTICFLIIKSLFLRHLKSLSVFNFQLILITWQMSKNLPTRLLDFEIKMGATICKQ